MINSSVSLSLTDSAFPYELAGSPKAWIPRLNVNLQFYKRHEYGGHFAALDNPKGLSEDLQEFFAQHYVAWAVMPGFNASAYLL